MIHLKKSAIELKDGSSSGGNRHKYKHFCVKTREEADKRTSVRMGLVYTIEAISPTSSDARIPVVLIHGFAGGVGLWAANIDAVAKRRIAYCFDLLGDFCTAATSA
ncbi:unnamed protein product [Gongylonema pulchrum]|uniref:AB hydrolase-1 domain-containing protein n=1 Tax=Gongylonema pulchrum TaxID=637853 RepID=A0A183ETY6_9BILA|nr:unnamed protein product [Gongylonema pulchrum]